MLTLSFLKVMGTIFEYCRCPHFCTVNKHALSTSCLTKTARLAGRLVNEHSLVDDLARETDN